ncbi:MAG: hypothetical protein WEB06_19520 [Actinomycetota bacterium]
MAATSSPTKKKQQVKITYNGTTLDFDYNPHQAAQALYQHAFHEFHVPESEREALTLYLPDNTTEVNRNVSLEDAGVQPDTTLILRPRQAGGGR